MGASILALPNCSDAEMLANVRINAARNLPWVEPREAHDGHAVLLGGGPSLADCLPEIQWRAERGQLIFALNGTARWLTDRGIIVDYGVILDARPSNAAFVGGIQPGSWLLASQCDVATFDAAGARALVWHFALEGIETALPRNIPATLVGGGITSGLTAMALVYMMGFRKIHLYGYDSSDRAGDAHPYAQAETAPEAKRVDVTVDGRTFSAPIAMYAQAQAFEAWARQLADAGALITVHGDGLLPAIAHAMEGSTPVEGMAA